MIFKVGSLVRFIGIFRDGTKVRSPRSVVVKIETPDESTEVEGRPLSPGEFYVDYVVVGGPLTVTFTGASGEFSSVTYDVEGSEASFVEPSTVEAPPRLEEPTIDRISARRRLKAAGIETDSTWSDAKLRGALEALDSYDF